MAVLDALKACSLLKGFTDTGLQILAGIASDRTFPRGAPLFVENMVAESLFIIGQGKVSISVKGNNGEEIPVGELGPGDSLGELALLQQGQRIPEPPVRHSGDGGHGRGLGLDLLAF